MALLNIFKKKEEEKKVKEKPLEKKEAVKIEPIKTRKKASKHAYKVLYSPHITEKAGILAGENKYVFKVWPKTNKIEVKKAVQDTYGVDVVGVNIVKIPRKPRRLGKYTGWRKAYKKAIVKVKKGQKIEILPR